MEEVEEDVGDEDDEDVGAWGDGDWGDEGGLGCEEGPVGEAAEEEFGKVAATPPAVSYQVILELKCLGRMTYSM